MCIYPKLHQCEISQNKCQWIRSLFEQLFLVSLTKFSRAVAIPCICILRRPEGFLGPWLFSLGYFWAWFMVTRCLVPQGAQHIPGYQPCSVAPISASIRTDLSRFLVLLYLLVDFCALKWWLEEPQGNLWRYSCFCSCPWATWQRLIAHVLLWVWILCHFSQCPPTASLCSSICPSPPLSAMLQSPKGVTAFALWLLPAWHCGSWCATKTVSSCNGNINQLLLLPLLGHDKVQPMGLNWTEWPGLPCPIIKRDIMRAKK